VASDGALEDGGYLPSAHVTALSLSLGNINPATGLPDKPFGPGMLMAATYGRGTFVIRLSPVHVGHGSFTAPEGKAFTGEVASFTDTDADTNPGDYTATIFWGDGTSSAGTVKYTGTPGNFTVDASGTPKTYAEEGTYKKFHVVIKDTADGATA